MSGRLLKGGTAFALCLGLQRAASLITLPLVVHYLTPAEYGQLALVVAVSSVLSSVVGFGLETAIYRSYFTLAEEPRRRERFLGSVGLFLLTVPHVVTGGVLLVAYPLLAGMRTLPIDYLAIGLLSCSVYVSATTLPFAVLRAEERLVPYAAINVAYVAAYISAMTLTIAMLGMGPLGYLLSLLTASTVMLGIGLFVVRIRWSLSNGYKELKGALGYGLPLVPHYVAHWGLSFSDRVILGAFVSLSALGAYNFAYQIGAVLGLLTVALQQALQPYFARAASGTTVDRDQLSGVVTLQALLVILLAGAFALLAPPLASAAFPKDYAASIGLIPWIVLGYGFFGLYLIPINMLSLVAGETRWIWLATAAAALTNFGLNLLFVPRYGVEAAAVSTAAGYGALLLCVTAYALSRGQHLSLDWRLLATTIAAVLAAFAVAAVTVPGGDAVALVTRIALLCAVISALFVARTLPNRRLVGS